MRQPLQHKQKRSSGGYALLLAILIANVVLAMSLGIFSIALKEVLLTTYIRDSQRAFGAADHMLECTLYWDMAYAYNGMPYTIFATSSAYVAPAALDSATCAGAQLNVAAAPPAGQGWNVTKTPIDGITTFSLRFPDGTCADVNVLENINGMVITSNGYSDCNPNNPRRTQRTLQVSSNL